ncbi:hypothetical protein AVEN_209266-1, partial [Araneus ventricosus]
CCNSLSTEARVLVPIIGDDTTPEGGTYYRRRDSSPAPISKSENPLTYPAAFHLRTRDAPRWVIRNRYSEYSISEVKDGGYTDLSCRTVMFNSIKMKQFYY